MSEQFFFTGGTGLVGVSLLPRILQTWPQSQIILLIRGQSAHEVEQRLQGIVARLNVEGIADAALRVRAMKGDVSLENLGLTAAQMSEVVDATTHIIHGAATIRFDHPLNEARLINCGGTVRVLALARTLAEKGRLARFAYIGSSSVSGQREGHVLEEELEMGQRFFNTYEHSKNEAERLVRNAFSLILATVFGPSIIIGDSRSGWTNSFNVIYIPLRLLYRGLLRYVPGKATTTLDLVPINWVADTMAYILSKEESVGKVFHQTAGPGRAATLGEVVLSATSYFDSHAPLRAPRTMEFLTRTEFERRRSLMRGREEALMGQLDTLLPYTSIDRLFDSRNTDALLKDSGIAFPLFKDYADRIFDFCLKTQWGKVND